VDALGEDDVVVGDGDEVEGAGLDVVVDGLDVVVDGLDVVVDGLDVVVDGLEVVVDGLEVVVDGLDVVVPCVGEVGVVEVGGDGTAVVVGAGEVGTGLVVDVVESLGPSVGDVEDVACGSIVGASPMMVVISLLNASSWAVISLRLYAEMPRANSSRRVHTSPSARSSSSPGSPATVSTSWLAIAAVMHR
jgi:hypothetical protein